MGNRKGICLRTASIKGFTLIELMVVITIILAVSVLLLPGVVTAIGERRLDASAQALQGAIVAARDGAKLDGAPRGIRLMPDPANPATFNRVVPLVTGPRYSEGLVSLPATGYVPPLPCLTIVQADYLHPTAWGWNVRVGDRLQIGLNTYTVCGPVTVANADGFVNYPAVGPFPVRLDPTHVVYLDYLFLVNGRDDNGDGFVDNGWDGLDNDGDGVIDDASEWEQETWTFPVAPSSPYTLIRRPVPAAGPQTVLSVPISLAASTLWPSPITGNVDLMIRQDGTVDLSGPHASQAAVSMGQAKSVFTLDDGKSQKSITLWTRTGRVESQ